MGCHLLRDDAPGWRSHPVLPGVAMPAVRLLSLRIAHVVCRHGRNPSAPLPCASVPQPRRRRDHESCVFGIAVEPAAQLSHLLSLTQSFCRNDQKFLFGTCIFWPSLPELSMLSGLEKSNVLQGPLPCRFLACGETRRAAMKKKRRVVVNLSNCRYGSPMVIRKHQTSTPAIQHSRQAWRRNRLGREDAVSRHVP